MKLLLLNGTTYLVNCGVWQSGILSTLLFNFYINEWAYILIIIIIYLFVKKIYKGIHYSQNIKLHN